MAGPVHSDMPYTSMMGMPRLKKNSRVDLEIGAAEVMQMRAWSRPSASRTLENTSLSATPQNKGSGLSSWMA